MVINTAVTFATALILITGVGGCKSHTSESTENSEVTDLPACHSSGLSDYGLVAWADRMGDCAKRLGRAKDACLAYKTASAGCPADPARREKCLVEPANTYTNKIDEYEGTVTEFWSPLDSLWLVSLRARPQFSAHGVNITVNYEISTDRHPEEPSEVEIVVAYDFDPPAAEKARALRSKPEFPKSDGQWAKDFSAQFQSPTEVTISDGNRVTVFKVTEESLHESIYKHCPFARVVRARVSREEFASLMQQSQASLKVRVGPVHMTLEAELRARMLEFVASTEKLSLERGPAPPSDVLMDSLESAAR